MQTVYYNVIKRITVLALAASLVLGSATLNGFAKDSSPARTLGISGETIEENNVEDENTGTNQEIDKDDATPSSNISTLGVSTYAVSSEINLPGGIEIYFYEELDGINNFYKYHNYATSEDTTGTFNQDTALLIDTAEDYNTIIISGKVTLQRINSNGSLGISFENQSEGDSLTLEEHLDGTPLKAIGVSITGSYDGDSSFTVKGNPAYNNYDIDVNTFEVSGVSKVSVGPNAIRANEQINLFNSNDVVFNVGANLPDGAIDGVYTEKLSLHSASSLSINSTNEPDNALHVTKDLVLYPGHLTVHGGSKNAILFSGDYMQSNHSGTIDVKITTPGSIGILYDPTETGNGISLNNTHISVQGDAYGIKINDGSFNLYGSIDWENPIGESTLIGGIAPLYIKANSSSYNMIAYHTLNLILSGNNPNALGALYFDSNNSSSQLSLAEDATINAWAEQHSFEGAAITVVDNFVPTEWATSPIMLEGNAQIKTTMSSHQGDTMWAIKSSSIDMGQNSSSSITHTYTDTVNISGSPSLPYGSSYNPEQFVWSTDPSGLDILASANGLSSRENTEGVVLTGLASSLPSPIISEQDNQYSVIYNSVSFSNRGVVTLDPTDGEIAQTSLNITIGQPIGELPTPTNPRKLFMGWYTEQNGIGTKIAPSYVVAASITIYAYWTTPTQQVTYHTDILGTAPVIQAVAMGELLAPPQLSKPGYTLVGWYTDATLTNEWDFASDFVPNSAVTLYAKWNLESYTVTFVTEGASTTKSFEFGTTVDKPIDPQNGDLEFLGWFYGNIQWSFEADKMPNQDITLTARWAGIEYYTLTFDNGTTTNSISVAYNSLVARPADPSKEGESFIGWFYDGALRSSIEWNFETDRMPKKDLVLHAHWQTDDDDDNNNNQFPWWLITPDSLGGGSSGNNSGGRNTVDVDNAINTTIDNTILSSTEPIEGNAPTNGKPTTEANVPASSGGQPNSTDSFRDEPYDSGNPLTGGGAQKENNRLNLLKPFAAVDSFITENRNYLPFVFFLLVAAAIVVIWLNVKKSHK